MCPNHASRSGHADVEPVLPVLENGLVHAMAGARRTVEQPRADTFRLVKVDVRDKPMVECPREWVPVLVRAKNDALLSARIPPSQSAGAAIRLASTGRAFSLIQAYCVR